MEAYFTTVSLAAFLHFKPQTLRKWRLSGEGPHYIRLGHTNRGRVLYRREDVEQWLQTRTFRHTAEETTRKSTECALA
jgi:hypothetical protein